MNKIKILILTSGTGGGHNTRSKALAEWFNKIFPESCDVRVEEILENSSKIGYLGVKINNFIDRFIPYFHYIYWYIVEIIGQLNKFYLLFGRKYFKNLITTYKPDIIISMHDFLNLGYFELAKQILNNNVKCITYCGEFSGGFGYSKNWVNKNSDWFIARTQEALSYAHKLGIDKNKSSVFTSLLNPKDFENILKEEEKKLFLSEKLFLDINKFTVFLSTGNNGYNNHINLLNILKKHYKEVQVIVICGKNKKVFNQVYNWSKNNPSLKTYIEGFSTKVTTLIQVSDVIVTRGGSNTSAESLYYGCPILYNNIKGKVPQEHLTINYFIKNKAALILKNEKEFDNIINNWKNFNEDYKNIKNNIKNIKNNKENPKNLVKFIRNLIFS